MLMSENLHTLWQRRSVGYRRPGRTAILPPPNQGRIHRGAQGARAPQTRNNVIMLSSFLSYRVFCRLSCGHQALSGYILCVILGYDVLPKFYLYHLRQTCTKIRFTVQMLQCNQHSEGPENAPKYAFRDPKIKKNSGEGALPPPQTSHPMGRTHTPLPFGACGASIRAPLALDVPPKPKSWIRPWLVYIDQMKFRLLGAVLSYTRVVR